MALSVCTKLACVERKFSHRNSHAVDSKVAQSEDSFAISDNDNLVGWPQVSEVHMRKSTHLDVFLRPVLQCFLDMAYVFQAEMKAMSRVKVLSDFYLR